MLIKVYSFLGLMMKKSEGKSSSVGVRSVSTNDLKSKRCGLEGSNLNIIRAELKSVRARKGSVLGSYEDHIVRECFGLASCRLCCYRAEVVFVRRHCDDVELITKR
jgi:hypothetical protein